MAKIGYARVSTEDQNLDRQNDALSENGAERIFLEKVSGVKKARPELTRMLEYVREGDTLIVESISRLARSTRDLLSIVDTLRDKRVDLVSLKEQIDTKTPQGRFVLSIFAALSELERETLIQRQREGIEAARRRGKHLGRPRAEYPKNWPDVHRRWAEGRITATSAMKELELTKPTFYRLAKRWKAANHATR